jgi:ubiquinone/menaquinone biosynthesis C-methylase UbiE
MVSIRQTTLKYRGQKAVTYETIRRKQARWHWEEEHVSRMLHALRPISVLDCPVGTGRFIPLYGAMSIGTVCGIDASEEMLTLARRKISRRMRANTTVSMFRGDASRIDGSDSTYDVVVCVRFLDLIDEEAMREVVRELCRVARRAVVLTIRLGPAYVPKSNTATHARAKFLALVRRLGFALADSIEFRDAGWTLMTITRGR